MKTRLRLTVAVIVFSLLAACAAPTPAAPAPSPTATSAPITAPKSPKNARHALQPTATNVPAPSPTSAPTSKIYLKIMPLGDSITFGWPDSAYGGYRHLLGTLLVNDGYGVDFVGSQQSGNGAVSDPDNEGHPGWTISRIRKGIDSNGWLETYQPGLILLHIGTNDLLEGDAASAPG